MKKRMHVFFSGTVQGIGFRFSTEDLARDLDVHGWVKNLKDGRVEVVAEAFEESLKEFLDKTKEHFSGYIADVRVQWEEPTGEFESFEIKFDY